MTFWQYIKSIWARLTSKPAPALALESGHNTAGAGPSVINVELFTASKTGNVLAHPAWSPDTSWDSGWWLPAVRRPAHVRRVGSPIVPRCVIVHTTDMLPGSFSGLVTAWTTQPGKGSCAHFLIGRDANEGVVQFVSVVRNANHAGGPIHGSYCLKPVGNAAPVALHPNSVAVGIELSCAGQLRRAGKDLVHPDSGRVIPVSEATTDGAGHWYHLVTPYQLETLAKLLDALQSVVHPLPPGSFVRADGPYGPNQVPWALTDQPQVVGHATLDPVNKTDPGPQVMAWINKRY